jgi:hypothetical protein
MGKRSTGRADIGWSISNDHPHRLPSRGPCIAKQLVLRAFRAPELGIQALASRAAILKI